jgi:hypothetical protein
MDIKILRMAKRKLFEYMQKTSEGKIGKQRETEQ